jgi:hypothetical protein
MPSRLTALPLLFGAAIPAAFAAPALLQVSAVVGPRVVAQVDSAPSVLVLQELDLERGYIDVAAPLVIRLRSNLSHPFSLEFRSALDVISRIETRAASLPLLQSLGGGLLVPAIAGEQSFTVHLRLFLGPQAVPGRYAWPVRLGGAG